MANTQTSSGRSPIVWLLFGFKGRISRSVYWLAYVFLIGVQRRAGRPVVRRRAGELPRPCRRRSRPFVILGTLYSNLAIAVKRLHDVGYSGFLAFALFIPLVNFAFTIWVGILPGTAGPNAYGDVTDIVAGMTSSSERERSLVELVRAPSVTPAAGAGARCAASAISRRRAFRSTGRSSPEPGSEPVENLFAAIGSGRTASDACRAMSMSCRPAPEERWTPSALRGGDRRRRALRARRGGHEGRARRHGRRGASLRREARQGLRRAALVPRHRRRGGRGGQRHGEAARMGGGARRALLRRDRRRADQRARARRPDQDRPARQLFRHASSSRARRATPPIRSWPTIRCAA